ncbi:MAG: hypothetical protein ABH813_02330 [Patescibacteria group bacterium]
MLKRAQTKTEEKNYPKVLLYASSPRNFRSSLIEYLYEISQIYPIVLLSEELDPETRKILGDKKLFPKLKEIIPVNQYAKRKMNLLARHRYFCKLAKKIIENYRPDIVIANGSNIFESYLRRFARNINAISLRFTEFLPGYAKQPAKEYILRIAYLKTPDFLPLPIKILFSKARTYLGHFLVYWILPLLTGQKPFLGEPSAILIADPHRFKGIDYFIVSSERDYNILLRQGLPAEKIYISAHPLNKESKVRRFFRENNFSNSLNGDKMGKKILTIMWPPEQIGFKRTDYSLIPKKELWEDRIKTTSLIAGTLKEWKIIIKPHPLAENVVEIAHYFKSIYNNIEVKNPTDFADRYIEISDVIAGLSPASNVLLNAFLQRPDNIILSLDFQQEFGGDYYKDFEGIEYINDRKKLINVLELIREKKYQKRTETKRELIGFPNTIGLLKHLLNQKSKF